MKKILVITLFMLATLAWAASPQQPDTSQAPGASQSQPSTPGRVDQGTGKSGRQAGSQGQAANAPVTEGCLGGSAPNFTITDKAGTTYKLNIPPNADTSTLAQHVGESVQVAGNVKDTSSAGNASIDIQGIGRGTGTCPSSGAKDKQTPPKQ